MWSHWDADQLFLFVIRSYFRVFPAPRRSSATRTNHRSAHLRSRTVRGLSGKTENKWPLNLISVLRGGVMLHSGPTSPDTGPLSACYNTNCRSFVLASYFSGPPTYYKLIFSDCRRAPALIIRLKVFILTALIFLLNLLLEHVSVTKNTAILLMYCIYLRGQ